MTRTSKSMARLLIIALILLVVVAACWGRDTQEMGVTNLSSLHLSDSNETATPVFIVNQDDVGAIAVFKDALTPVVSFYDGGDVLFAGGVEVSGAVTFGGGIAMEGAEITLDADGDTSITADTDDQVDLEIGNADEFVFIADELDVTLGQIVNIGNAGTDFTTAGGLTLAGPLLFPDGAVGAPALAHSTDTDTGFYRIAQDNLGLAIAGALDFDFAANDFDLNTSVISNIGNANTDFDTNGGLTLAAPLFLPDGAVGAPAIATTSDINTGFYRVSEDVLGLSINGALDFQWGANDMDVQNSIISNIGNAGTDFDTNGGLTLAAPLIFPDGAVGAPALAHVTDTDTGFYRIAQDNLGLSIAGALDFDFSANDFDLNTSIISNIGNANTDFETNGGLTLANVLTVSTGGSAITGASTHTLGAAEYLLVDGATTPQTHTAGALDVNATSVTADTAALDVLMTANDLTAGATDIYGARLTITNNDADADMFGLKIVASATANAGVASYEYGLLYDCAEDTGTACTDGILLTSTGVNLAMTDGLDVSDANILNAVNIGVNPILGSNGDSFTMGVTDDAFIVTREDAGSVTYSCADDNTEATCIYDSGVAGTVEIGSADTTGVTLNTVGNVLTMADAPAASAGGDFLNLAGTFNIANGSDDMVGLNMDITGANHAGTDNSTTGIDLGLTTPDPQVPEVGLLITDIDWDYAIDVGPLPIMATANHYFEDFLGTTIPDEMTLLSGSDEVAVDPAIVQAQYGTVALVGGNSNANCLADCSILSLGLHWSADQGSLVFETRVKIDDVTTVAVCVGMTDDISTVEMPMTLTTDTPTGIADDFIGFCYDTNATTDQWWFVGVNATTEATGNAATGVTPSNGAFEVLRVEVDANGEDARGYIDGSLVGTITADSVAEAVLLSPNATCQSLVAGARTLTLDYFYVGAQRQ